MKKFLLLISMAFMVTLIPFNSNASPPDYDEIGMYEVPVFDVDNLFVASGVMIIEDANLTDVYCIDLEASDLPVNIYSDNTEMKSITDMFYSDTGKHSNSQILISGNEANEDIKLNYAIDTEACNSYPLLCYTFQYKGGVSKKYKRTYLENIRKKERPFERQRA